MKMKLLGSVVTAPSASNMSLGTLIHVVATAATTLILKKESAGATIGTIYIPANGTIDLVKAATDEVTCPTSKCTHIAYIS